MQGTIPGTGQFRMTVLERNVTVPSGVGTYTVTNGVSGTKAVVIMSTISPAFVFGGIESFSDSNIVLALNNFYSETLSGVCKLVVFS